MADPDDALRRRLQAYFADLDGEPIPGRLDRLHLPADLPQPRWQERFLLPAIVVSVAIATIILVVLISHDRDGRLDTGDPVPLPTRANTTATTLGDNAQTVTRTVPSANRRVPSTAGGPIGTVPVSSSATGSNRNLDDGRTRVR